MKKLLAIILAFCLTGLAVPASAGFLDIYKILSGERGWHTKINAAWDAIQNAALTLTVPEIDHIGNYSNDLPTAVAAIGSARKRLLINAATTVNSNVTVPATLQLEPTREGQLNIATGVTATLNCPVPPVLFQWLNCTGTGKVVFGAGTIKEVYPEWWADNTTPGITDMTAAINAALQSTVAWGGKTKLNGTAYFISASVAVGSYQTLAGVNTCGLPGDVGKGTTIIASADIDMVTVAGMCPVVRDVFLYASHATYSHWNLLGTGTDAIPLIQPHFERVTTQTALTATAGGIKVYHSGASDQSSFEAHIDKCWLREGSIYLGLQESRITNSVIWAGSKAYAIQPIFNACSIVNNEIVPGTTAGIWITNSGGSHNFTRIIGNDLNSAYGMAGYSASGPAILADYTSSSYEVIGNEFTQNNGHIYLTDSSKWKIIGNSFYDSNTCDTNPGADSIRITATGAGTSFGNIITNNTFYNPTARAHPGYAINEVNAGGDPITGNYTGNVIGGDFVAIALNVNRSLAVGQTAQIAGNKAGTSSGYDLTYMNGEGVVLTSNTTQSFSFGGHLIYAPKASEINISFSGAVAIPWYIHDITSAGFQVTWSADPSALTMNWSAQIR